MPEMTPFESDPAAEAGVAYDGLVDALARLRDHEMAGLPLSDSADEVAELSVRVIDLLAAALDAAGVDEAELRSGALNVFRTALEGYTSNTALTEPDDADYAEDEVRDAVLAAFVAGRLGRPTVAPHPLQLPFLSFAGPADAAQRN